MSSVAPPTADQLARATRRLGRYVVFESLGSGGFGSVYRAWDPTLSRWVAVKVLQKRSPKAQQRFLREIQSVARLRHPHVVEIHDAGQQGDDVYLVMEFVPGQTFEALGMAGLNPRRAAELTLEVAEAVAHAHQRQVWHRDLKPGNVLVDRDGQARVLDFGLAFLAGDDSQRLSQPGLPLGTPAFMPPEQVHGRPTAQSDVWGLGALLYFALARQAPFDGHAQPMVAVQERLPEPPSANAPETPAALEAICMRCLATEPVDRYADPAAVAEALRAYLRGEPTAAAGPGLPALLAGGAALLAAAALGVALASRPADPDAPPPASSSPSPPASASPPPASPPSPTIDPERALARAARLSREQAPFEEVAALLTEASEAAHGETHERIELAHARLELRRARLEAGIARLVRQRFEHHADEALQVEAELRFQNGIQDPLGRALVQRMIDGPPGIARDTASALHSFLSGDQLGAIQQFRAITAAHPREPTPQLLLGRGLVVLGDVQGAKAAAEVALDANPDDFRAYTILRDAALGAGDAQASLAASDTLFRLVGEAHVPWVHRVMRSIALGRLQRFEEQLAELNAAVELAPHEVRPRVERALYHVVHDQPASARADFAAALRANPTETKFYVGQLPPALRQRCEAVFR